MSGPSFSDGVPLVPDAGARKRKLVTGLVLLPIAGLLGWLAVEWGFLAGMGAFIFGVAGISLVAAAAFGFSGCGPCPTGCGRELRDVPGEMEGLLCPNCGDYVNVRDRKLFRTPPDAIAASPRYWVRIGVGERPAFPAACLGCAAPATRHLDWELERTGLRVPGVARVVRRWTISVPLCDGHGLPLPGERLPPACFAHEGELKIGSYAVWKQMREASRAGAA